MSVRPIVSRITTLLTALAVAAGMLVAFATPASAASKRCGYTGYEKVFTLNPTKGKDFRISVYRKPAAKDPKSKAPRCVILWANKKGKATLKVDDWSGTKWSKTASLKKGGHISRRISKGTNFVDLAGDEKTSARTTHIPWILRGF